MREFRTGGATRSEGAKCPQAQAIIGSGTLNWFWNLFGEQAIFLLSRRG